MKYVKTYENFLYEADSKRLESIRKSLEGEEKSRTVIGMYRFYYEGGYKEIKDPKELISKVEYYDQTIRQDDVFDAAQKAGINPIDIDKKNLALIKPFIKSVKPGTEEFSKVWLVVQHADFDVNSQKEFLEIHGESMKKTDSTEYLYMKDRISANEKKPQEGISQGAEVQLGKNIGWLPWQNANIEFEKEPVIAKDPDTGKEVALLKWKEGETSKVSKAVEATIGAKKAEAAREAGMEVNLKNYVEHIMGSTYLGPYMIKR